MAGKRHRLKPAKRDIFITLFTNTVITFVDTQQRLVDAVDFFTFAIAKPVEVAKPVEESKPPVQVEQVVPAQAEAVKSGATQDSSQRAVEARFETVYFDFDKSDLRQDARDVLSKNAEIILKSLAGAKITPIVG